MSVIRPAIARMNDARLHKLRVLGLTILGLLLVFRAMQFAVASNGPSWGYDLDSYLHAARLVAAGEYPYDALQLAGPYVPQQRILYTYPPVLATALAPVASVDAMKWAWAAVGLLLLAGSVYAVTRRGLYVALALSLAPVVFELAIGNVHMLLLALFTIGWLGVRRQDDRGEFAAGMAVGVATIVKIFPGAMILWFVATRRWKAAAAALGTMAALGLVTIPIVGLQPWLDYPRILSNIAAPAELWSSLAPTAWLAPTLGFAVARVLVTLAGAVVLVWSARTHDTRRSFAVAVTISVMVAPTMYPHYLALLVLPWLLLEGRARWLAYAALLIGGTFALLPLSEPINRTIASLVPLVILSLAVLPGRFLQGTPDRSTLRTYVDRSSPAR